MLFICCHQFNGLNRKLWKSRWGRFLLLKGRKVWIAQLGCINIEGKVNTALVKRSHFLICLWGGQCVMQTQKTYLIWANSVSKAHFAKVTPQMFLKKCICHEISRKVLKRINHSLKDIIKGKINRQVIFITGEEDTGGVPEEHERVSKCSTHSLMVAAHSSTTY